MSRDVCDYLFLRFVYLTMISIVRYFVRICDARGKCANKLITAIFRTTERINMMQVIVTRRTLRFIILFFNHLFRRSTTTAPLRIYTLKCESNRRKFSGWILHQNKADEIFSVRSDGNKIHTHTHREDVVGDE